MILIAVAIVLALLAGSAYAIVLNHEEEKAERRKFARIASANSESREWPVPPGPKGGSWRGKKAA